jgi:hypothetical protein
VDKIFDGLSVGVVIGTLLGWLPYIAALFSLTWSGIQIYEWYQKKKKPNGTKTS